MTFVNLILEREQEVQNEQSNSEALKLTFEQWQDVIELEKKIISDQKQIFHYQQKYYDSERQILILTLKEPISLEQFDQITSPPLSVTISVKSTSPKPRHEGIGYIIDREKGSQGESIAKLHISIGDFCDPEVLASILDKGTIETNFKAQESEVERRRKALKRNSIW